MKVMPRLKKKPLHADEVRIITINEDAVLEILRENLLEKQSQYFDLDSNSTSSGDIICITKWNRSKRCLTYAVMPINRYIEGIDLDRIINKVGITTDSVFGAQKYKSIVLSEKTGDGLREPF